MLLLLLSQSAASLLYRMWAVGSRRRRRRIYTWCGEGAGRKLFHACVVFGVCLYVEGRSLLDCSAVIIDTRSGGKSGTDEEGGREGLAYIQKEGDTQRMPFSDSSSFAREGEIKSHR